MRLIDADVLLYNTDGLEHVKWSQEYGHVVLVCDIVYAPTVDVQEVKHGKWIVDEDGNIECSVCGHHGVGDLYCERCGAKMNGENE